MKPSINEKGEKEIEPITTSQALQIAGRAGRFSSKFKEGEVTTMNREDLSLLKEILNRPVEPIKVRCNIVIATSLWRTVIPSFTYFPDFCLRHLKTNKQKKILCHENHVKKTLLCASLVVQWLRICLPIQGTRVRALVREDPTCCGATKPVHHNY